MADPLIPGGFAPPVTTASPGVTSLGGVQYGRVDPKTGAFSFYTLTVPADTLNRSASSAEESQATVAASGSAIPICYGWTRRGAMIAGVCVYNGSLVIRAVWCIGEISAIDQVYVNEAAMPGTVTATHYLGTATQGVDPTLVTAYAANAQTYSDTLAGVAYSVFVFPAGSTSGFPRITARIKGLLVKTDSGGTMAFSRNPAYILADLIESTTHGMGRSVDWTSVQTVAAVNDTLLSDGTRRHLCDLALDAQQPCETWLNVLRDYAGCWVVPEGSQYRLVADRPRATDASFTDATIVAGSMRLSKRGSSQTPTCVEVTYTDWSQVPWRDAKVTVYASGVLAGTTPRRMSRVSKPGLVRQAQAHRYAIERLNEATLNDLTATFDVFDAGISLQVGDVISVTHSVGLTSKLFRVVKVEPNGLGGRWTITACEYDAAKYSDDVVSEPSTPDTTLPSPTSPPTVTGLAATEDIFQDLTGYYASRLLVSWTAPTYPFVSGYVVTIKEGATLRDSATVTGATSYASKALPENVLYTVSVAILTTLDVVGTAASVTITNNGKSAKPGDVPRLDAYEIGGEVRISWDPATDKDLTGYEIRWGSTSDTWATATLLDRVAAPAVRYATKEISEGTRRIFIKALDSIRSTAYPYGQESLNAETADVVVTSDAAAFVAAAEQFVGPPTLKSMVAYNGGWITNDSATWNATYSSTLNSYTNVLLTYHGAASSALWTDILDLGAATTGDFSISGDYQGSMTYTELEAGITPIKYLQLITGGESTLVVDDATNATPIVCRTSVAHNFNTGEEVVIAGVGGNTNANGRWLITVTDTTHFSLQYFDGTNRAGNAAYTSAGTVSRWAWNNYTTSTVRTTARYARQLLTTTGTVYVSSLGRLQVSVIAQPDAGAVVLDADSDTDATVAACNKPFVRLSSIQLTPVLNTSSGAAIANYDQVEVSGGRGIQSGRVARFNGSTQYVQCLAFTLGSSVTVECWVKPDGWTATGIAQNVWSLDCTNPKGDGTTRLLGLRTNNTGVKLALSANDSTNNYFAANGGTGAWVVPPAAGIWTHLAVVIVAGQLPILYVNGLEAGRGQTARDPAAGVAAGYYFTAGCKGTVAAGGWESFYKGCIDAFRIWNTARSAADILANYTLALTTASNLALNWNFDEITGTSAADSSGNGRTGTVTGAVAQNRRMWRPYDGFDVYTFDATGTQLASNTTPGVSSVSWYVQGI